jgi:hypothetical protein
VARELGSTSRRGALHVLFVVCCAVGVGTVVACNAEGITPNCSPDGSDCVTPPGDAAETTNVGSMTDAGAG